VYIPEIGKWTIKQWELNSAKIIEAYKLQQEVIDCYEKYYDKGE